MDPRKGTEVINAQMQDLLSTIQNVQYAQPLESFNGSSVGQHIRHIIDFYLCLLKGVAVSEVNYDQRERNENIETDCLEAKVLMNIITEKVQQLDIDQPLRVCSSFVADERVALRFISSSVGRELMYAYDHAIHHLAIVKIGMQIHFPAITTDSDLGVAPSTLKYRKQCVQ
jgi:hypothetical protein